MSTRNGSIQMVFDGIVIGGGPAGMFAALTAAEQGQKVLLLEKNDRLGKKLLITGKGRCNITNACDVDEVLKNIPRNGRFLYSVLNAYTPKQVMDFFSDHGCPIKVERGNRVFPVSDQALSVLNSLMKRMQEVGVVVKSAKVESILTENGAVTGVCANRQKYSSEWVILATGGVSYPTTGSTGDGYKMAQTLGHTVVEPEGSLVPLVIDGDDCQRMQGLSLRNIGVRILNEKGKTLYTDFGELLFTHFGVSGPTILSGSAHLKGANCKLIIDLKPALDEAKLNDRILRDLEMYQNRSMENALSDLLPRSMIPVVLDRLKVDGCLQANSFTKTQRRALVSLLKNFDLNIVGKRPVSEAIITSGGIKTSEINPKTMMSKLVKNLYFAGEIIDCDAYTGGFNLQIAWSTAFAAGTAVKNED